jgi:hypothetical protein
VHALGSPRHERQLPRSARHDCTESHRKPPQQSSQLLLRCYDALLRISSGMSAVVLPRLTVEFRTRLPAD